MDITYTYMLTSRYTPALVRLFYVYPVTHSKYRESRDVFNATLVIFLWKIYVFTYLLRSLQTRLNFIRVAIIALAAYLYHWKVLEILKIIITLCSYVTHNNALNPLTNNYYGTLISIFTNQKVRMNFYRLFLNVKTDTAVYISCLLPVYNSIYIRLWTRSEGKRQFLTSTEEIIVCLV